MSFEGRYQKLCPNGHYTEECVYMETEKCGECGQRWLRKNLVDDTNDPGEGYDESMIPSPKKPGLRQSFALFLADYKAKNAQ